MPRTYLKNSIVMALLLCSLMAFVLLAPTLKRGLFFREDYLPYLSTISVLFAVVSGVAAFRGDSIWRGDVDILLALIVGLYFLTYTWAQSRMDALDGALKYAGYLMVFVMARYASASELGSRILRNLLVLSGVVVASAGYLTAAGIAEYPSSVRSGALLGSFQYPNALAAFAMFLLFLLYYAWHEGFRNPALDLAAGIVYSASAFLLVGSVFLTDSRATLLMFGGFVVVYGVLLPSGARAEILSRAAVSLISFASVGSSLDTALRKSDVAGMRKGLAIGLALAAALEVGRWFWDKRMAYRTRAAQETASTTSGTERTHLSAKAIFLRVAAAGLVVAVCGAALIAGAKNPATAKVLSKVLPERMIGQLKTLRLTDVSMIIRLMAAKDALSIALGYPFGAGAGGWKALYHQYHRTPYWFTETHNHFAQILVEVGFPGLAIYIVFWGILAYAAIKTYLLRLKGLVHEKDVGPGPASTASGSGHLARVTSTAMAVLALGIHSALDFDLSLPAISVALFAAIAVLLADTGEAVPRIRNLGAIERIRSPRAASEKKSAKRQIAKGGFAHLAFPWALVITILAAAILAPSVALTANRLYQGMAYASRGDQIMRSSGDLFLARRYIGEAMKRDKWNPSYSLELAEWAIDDFLATRNPTSKGMIPLYLQAARIADPTDLDRQLFECQSFRKAGMIDEAVRSGYDLVLMMPTNREFHESLADLGRAAISEHVKAVLQDEVDETERQKHVERLSACSELLRSAFDILAAKRERVTGIYRIVFNPKGLDFTPKMALAAGEVAFLMGDAETSQTMLSAAAKDKNLAQEANTWLSYLSEATGLQIALPEGFRTNVEETRKMASLCGTLEGAR